MSEDPIHFDIWGIVRKGANEKAVQWMLTAKTWPSLLEIRKAANLSTTKHQSIRIVRFITWSDVTNLRKDTPEWLESFEVFQEGYTPFDKAKISYCSDHDLYYGGVCGCHVCTGFFVK